jgi:hypothetical protein
LMCRAFFFCGACDGLPRQEAGMSCVQAAAQYFL